jgi:SNF2 family DNA or RNA helicase
VTPELEKLSKVLASDEHRLKVADQVKIAKHVQLPTLETWNDKPCLAHHQWKDFDGTIRTGIPKPGCRRCGVLPRNHQTVGSTWLYLRKRALLADGTGTGKTVNCALLIAMMKESGELRGKKRILIVCRAPAILQWRDELHRVMPSLRIEVASGTKRERMNKYCYSWEVLIIGPEMLLKDDEILENFQFAAIITDDVDTLRNRKNKSAFAIRRLANRSPRMVIMSATPLQKRLPEMYGVLESIGGRELFGSEFRFIQRYVRTENVFHASYHGPGAKAKRIVGYQNIQEFKGLIAPMVLRRTPSDIDDVSMPAISPNDVYLDLYPAQRAKYEELRQGVLKIVRETGVQVKHAEAMAQLIYGAQICTGLVSIGETDGPRTAVKLDWLMERLEDGGEFATEKVVVFAQWKNSIRAIQDRQCHRA